MREFLHGWRRKMGAVTLVMACVFTAAWVRSLIAAEVLFIPMVSNGGLVLFTGRGLLYARVAPEIGNQISIEPLLDAEFTMIVSEFTSIPYWSIVIPLTLLSAYLLLSTPRPTPQQPVTHA